jgi:hypothetical protein
VSPQKEYMTAKSKHCLLRVNSNISDKAGAIWYCLSDAALAVDRGGKIT